MTAVRGSRFLAALLLTVPALLLTACGVPTDQPARGLTAGEIPRALASPAPPDQPGNRKIALYFVQKSEVQLVIRDVDQPVSLPDLTSRLFAGPTPSERARGFSSLITDVVLQDVRLVDGVAVVSLTGDASKLPVQAYAQIVATVVNPDNADILGVRFRLDGKDLSVLRGSGNLSSRPLRRLDYQTLLPSPAPSAVAAASSSSPSPSA